MSDREDEQETPFKEDQEQKGEEEQLQQEEEAFEDTKQQEEDEPPTSTEKEPSDEKEQQPKENEGESGGDGSPGISMKDQVVRGGEVESAEQLLASIGRQDEKELDPAVIAQEELIKTSVPATELELAMHAALERKDDHVEKLTAEILKLKGFISKRKQTYKRKRKDSGAPTRALSGYNIFIKERFAQLAKQNEEALKSTDSELVLKRVPPANLVAKTGNEWKDLPAEEKAKYNERAKGDRKRYEDQMTQYQPPDKQSNRKRNKTGYNMFFSAHVLRLKQTESGVPSERGSVARLVGTAWKQLSADEKQYYEREADKHNGMNPVKEGEEDEEEDEVKRQQMEHYHMHPAHAGDMHMQHGGVPPPMHAGMQQHPQHDPRAGYYHPMYGQPAAAYGHYDYSQHHQRHQQARAQQGYSQSYPPPQRNPYEG